MKKILLNLALCFSTAIGFSQQHISPNYNSTAYLNNKGEVFMAGRNTEIGYTNTLGTGSTINYVTNSGKVTFPNNIKIKEVASSISNFNLALSCEGQVYAWGLNEQGELGIPWQTSSFSATPIKVNAGETGITGEFLSNVKSVSIGSVQAYALLENGKAVAWGKNIESSWGSLGIGSTLNTSNPSYIRKTADSILENIIQIKSGEGITIALVDNDHDGLGTVYIWGKNNTYTNLINRTDNLNFARPLLDANGKEISNIKQISIGSANAMLLDRDNYVWIWGDGTFAGQGQNDLTKKIFPVKVLGGVTNSKYLKAKEIACGNAFSMALTLNNSVVTWGLQDNQAGNLGSNTINIEFAPIYPTTSDLKPLSNIIKIYAGGGSGFAINSDNQIYCWGYNANGELSYGNTQIVKLAKLNPVTSGFALADIAPHNFIISQNKEKLCIRETVDLSLNEPYLKSTNYSVDWKYIDIYDVTTSKKDTVSVENPGKYYAIVTYNGTNKICSAPYNQAKQFIDLDSYLRGFTVSTPTTYCGTTAEIEILSNNKIIWYENKNSTPYETTEGSQSLIYPVSRQNTADFKLFTTEKPAEGAINTFNNVPTTEGEIFISSANHERCVKVIAYNDLELKSLSFIYKKGYNPEKTFTSNVLAYSNTNLQSCGALSPNTPLVATSTSFSFQDAPINFNVQGDPLFKVITVNFALSLKGSPEGITYWLTIADLQKLGQGSLLMPKFPVKSTWSLNSTENKLTELKGQINYCTADTNNSFLYNIQILASNKCQPLQVDVYKDCPTAVEAEMKNTITMFPNPSTQTVYFKNLEESDKITLLNANGTLIREIQNGENISDLMTGVYIVSISRNNELSTLKLIKE